MHQLDVRDPLRSAKQSLKVAREKIDSARRHSRDEPDAVFEQVQLLWKEVDSLVEAMDWVLAELGPGVPKEDVTTTAYGIDG